MSEDIEKIPELHPRDILQPIATLIGLLVATIGFLKSATLQPGIFQGLVTLIGVMIGIFVVVAALTTLFFSTRRRIIWRIALALYPISWLVFGIGVLFILLEVGYAPLTVQLPQLPQIPLTDLLVVVLSLIATIVPIIAALRTRREPQYVLGDTGSLLTRSELKKVLQEADKETELSSGDVRTAFLRKELQIEDLLTKIMHSRGFAVPHNDSKISIADELYDRKIIDSYLRMQLKALRDIKNRMTHGYDVSDSVVTQALYTAMYLVPKLETLIKK